MYYINLLFILFTITVFTLINQIIINEISKNEFHDTNIVHINQINPIHIKKNYTFLKEFIKKHNSKPTVINHKYLINHSILAPNTLIILIQVHKRLQNLEWLVKSLSNIKFINQTLIIFSHDYYDIAINKFIKSIKFASVLQIYYPFMLQLYRFVSF